MSKAISTIYLCSYVELRLKELLIERFIFLRTVLGEDPELSDKRMLEIFTSCQDITRAWALYLREPEFAKVNMPTTFGCLRELLMELRLFEVGILGKLIAIESLPRARRTPVLYQCLEALGNIDKNFDDLEDVETTCRSRPVG